MTEIEGTRRQFLKAVGATAVALSIPSAYAADAPNAILVDPKPRFELSPYLYMQFMEPLGTTDGSVAAAWDFGRDCWRQDVIDVTRRLAPTMMRWGGCFSSYYRWKEAVGPRDKRVPMLNMCWGGIDTSQVGTVEFVDFCQQV
jgi:alpha-N-arabinofuranosidase